MICVRNRTTLGTLESPTIISPTNYSSFVFGTSIPIIINSPIFSGQTISESIVEVSSTSSMGNSTTYRQSYSGTQLTYIYNLAKGATYYIRCALVGSLTGQTGWSSIIQISIQMVAIDESWIYTTPGKHRHSIIVSGYYMLESGGGGGGAVADDMYGPHRVCATDEGGFRSPSCSGGGGGGASVRVYLNTGTTLNITVGEGANPVTNPPDTVSTDSGGYSEIAGYVKGFGGGGAYTTKEEVYDYNTDLGYCYIAHSGNGGGWCASGGSTHTGGNGGVDTHWWNGAPGDGYNGYGSGGYMTQDPWPRLKAVKAQNGFCRITFKG